MAKTGDKAAARDTKTDAKNAAQGAGAEAAQDVKQPGRSRLHRLWYEEHHREVIIYYLTAVFCLELIVGVVAFFYGVTNAEPLVPGGPKMARFPWIGWLVASILSPVGLLLLLHLSGQFFSRAFGGGEGGSGGQSGADGVVPERVQRFYAIARHAPTIVILLALIAMGCAVLFIDSAMQMAMAVGAALKPHLLWIIAGVVCFLLFGYLGRLWFIARHRRIEQEYAYRMKVLETTGIVIMNKDCLPLRYENGQLQLLAQPDAGGLKALPGTGAGADATFQAAADEETDQTDNAKPVGAVAAHGADVEDATIVSKS